MTANVLVETEGLSKKEWLEYRKHGIEGKYVKSYMSRRFTIK